ncbi:unnamed protein product, partial [Prorocentrum cordatum]
VCVCVSVCVRVCPRALPSCHPSCSRASTCGRLCSRVGPFCSCSRADAAQPRAARARHLMIITFFLGSRFAIRPPTLAWRPLAAILARQMAGKEGLVDQVKGLQRSDPAAKEAWWTYCDEYLGGVKDPNRHDARTLSEFLSFYSGGGSKGAAPSKGSTAKGKGAVAASGWGGGKVGGAAAG